MWGWEYIAVLRVMLMGVTKDPADNIKRKFFIKDTKILAIVRERDRKIKPRQHIKKQQHHFADKGPYNSQSYGFSSSHVWM